MQEVLSLKRGVEAAYQVKPFDQRCGCWGERSPLACRQRRKPGSLIRALYQLMVGAAQVDEVEQPGARGPSPAQKGVERVDGIRLAA